MQNTIERYRQYKKDVQSNTPQIERYTQQLRLEAENMAKKIEFLEVSKRRMLGQNLGSCSIDELQEVENQLERSLRNIRTRKGYLFKEQILQLKAKPAERGGGDRTVPRVAGKPLFLTGRSLDME
ncbi:hypothetical protein GOBAR_DD34638 [Gossypium barbadense]|nr:hypothetical protein GOBAR_DD34638 [Gossypium barbadense]